MRRVSFALVLTLLVLSFGLANAGFRVEISSVYTETMPGYEGDYINLGAGTVTIYHANEIAVRTGWSTPFKFSGDATLAGPMTHTYNPDWAALWSAGFFEAEESWDGDLSTPDQWNLSGISISGVANNGTEYWIGTVDFAVTGADDPTVLNGQFCVDSGDFADDTYDWLFDPPEPWGLGSICYTVKKQSNVNADFTNCPGDDVAMQWSGIYNFQLLADDDEGDTPYTFSVEAEDFDGTVEIDQNGNVTVNPTCADVGSHSATFGVSDTQNAAVNTCTITFTVGNTAPVIGGDCGDAVTIGTNLADVVVGSFSATDANTGDVFSFDAAITDYDGVDPVEATVFMNGSDVEFTSTAQEGTYEVTVTVSDCDGATSSCTMDVTVVGVLPFEIMIEKAHDVPRNTHTEVAIKKMEGTNELHGFDFLIGYDATALTFFGAEMGQPLVDLEWEYFTYRYNWNGNCGNGCPTGLLRVVGMGETNDGAHNPLGFDIANGSDLAVLDFLVTSDQNYQCMFVPVYFYWMDCGDNTLAFKDNTAEELGIQTGVSNDVYMYGGTVEYNGEFYRLVSMVDTYPTAYGFQDDECPDPEEGKPAPAPIVNFFGGGVDIQCVEDIDDRGDINLNGITYEIADAVVFTNYFIYGPSAFTINPAGQSAATDVNADGLELSVADLVYLIRVIVGDALPYPKVVPTETVNFVAGNAIRTDAEIGAAYFVFEGNASVELGSGATGLELLVNYDGTNTNALLYSMNEGAVASGELLRTDGNLVSVEAASYDATPYKSHIVPNEFKLEQNYPNPFNPTTVINMSIPVASDWSIDIYNVLGQNVASFNGFSEAGNVSVTWDASQQSSGIYFYKASAGDFSGTKKMVLMK